MMVKARTKAKPPVIHHFAAKMASQARSRLGVRPVREYEYAYLRSHVDDHLAQAPGGLFIWRAKDVHRRLALHHPAEDEGHERPMTMRK
jgi:hypothetical protein